MPSRHQLFLVSFDLPDHVVIALTEHLREFALAANAVPLQASISVETTPAWISGMLGAADTLDIADLNARLLDQLIVKALSAKVLVASPPDHRFARSAKTNNPHAQWGAAFPGGPLGLVYGNLDRFVVWHEILHLFGAADCYQLPNRGPTCDHPRCIMQYEPSEKTTGPRLMLCPANQRIVRQRLAL